MDIEKLVARLRKDDAGRYDSPRFAPLARKDAAMDGSPLRWDMLTSPEIHALVQQGMDLAILPVAATEQRGPHLATGCDTLLPEQIALLVPQHTGVPVLPAIPYGVSLGHTDRWPGAISLQPRTLIQLVLEVGRWTVASGFPKLIMLNGNGPNAPALECARIQLRHELPRARLRVLSLLDLSPRIKAHYFSDGSDIHANSGVTELLTALLPAAGRCVGPLAASQC
jgi:creatinine amidohydrolase